MNVNSVKTRDYKNDYDSALRKTNPNKPNSNPKQTQSKPISEMLKMKLSSVKTKDYENDNAFALRKTNPKQTQFQGQNQKYTIRYTFFVVSCVLFDLFATRQDGSFFTLPADYEKPAENKLLLSTAVENDIIVWL